MTTETLPKEITDAMTAYGRSCDLFGYMEDQGTDAEAAEAERGRDAARHALEAVLVSAFREARDGGREEARRIAWEEEATSVIERLDALAVDLKAWPNERCPTHGNFRCAECLGVRETPGARGGKGSLVTVIAQKKAMDAAAPRPEGTSGDWWCPECKEALDGSRVTFAERCDTCGTPVTVTGDPALVRAKKAEAERDHYRGAGELLVGAEERAQELEKELHAALDDCHALNTKLDAAEAARDEALRYLDAVGHALGICYDHDHGCGGHGPIDEMVRAARECVAEQGRRIDAEVERDAQEDRAIALYARASAAEASLATERDRTEVANLGLSSALGQAEDEHHRFLRALRWGLRRGRQRAAALARAEKAEAERDEARREAERQKRHNALVTATLRQERERRKSVQAGALAAEAEVRRLRDGAESRYEGASRALTKALTELRELRDGVRRLAEHFGRLSDLKERNVSTIREAYAHAQELVATLVGDDGEPRATPGRKA